MSEIKQPTLVQLSFLVPAAEIKRARGIAREYWQIPPEVKIVREIFGFGDYIEYPLGPSEGAESTYFFCSDTYRIGEEFGSSEHFKAWLAQQGPEEWLRPLEGDTRPVLADLGLVLTERKPDYPAQILGIDT